MGDLPIRPDLAQAAGPMLARWYTAELAAATAVLRNDEVVASAVTHRDGLAVLTTDRVVVQHSGEPIVPLSYREIDDVLTETGSELSRVVLRAGSRSAVLEGLSYVEAARVVRMVRATNPLAEWRTCTGAGSAVPSPRGGAVGLSGRPVDHEPPEPSFTPGPNAAVSFTPGPAFHAAPPDLPVEEPVEWTDVADEPSPGPGLGTFEIHALGPTGAGKTVYMAALYAQMRIRRPSSTFHLRSDFASSSRLNAVYNEIEDIAAGWPDSTKVSAEWEFTACMRSDTGDFEPLRFRYLDYPGGILTNPRLAAMPEVQANLARLRNANALLILLDGQAMAALMEGDPSGRRYLSFELTSSLEIAQQSRCPIHFVITKWDVLASRYTLEQVRAQLLADYNFRDLVEARAQDSTATIRLIPVSAVGFDYAAQSADGSMHKLGGRPRPYNVDIPLISVLPDFLTMIHATVARQREELAAVPEPQAEGRLSAAARKVSALAVHTAVKRWFPLFGLVPTAVVEQAIGLGDRLLARRSRSGRAAAQARDELLAKRRAVDSEFAAVDLLMQECAQVVEEFEEAHPASVLTGGLIAAEAGAAAS